MLKINRFLFLLFFITKIIYLQQIFYMKIIRKILFYIAVSPIKFYQYFISPFTPASCRHVPTCSEYSIEAIRIHGIFKGTFFGLKRLSKCHPWGTSGYDPVPPKNTEQK